MEFRNIVTFLRITELSSFTKVANELGYAQSTITTQIQNLEDELGYPLLDRIGKKFTVTENGEKFAVYARQIIKLIEQMENIKKTPSEITGTLRIGVINSLLSSYLIYLLPKLNKIFPRVKIEINETAARILLDELKHNQLDIVYILDKKTFEKNCICAHSRAEHIFFVTSPDNPLAKRKNIPLKEVLAQPLILTEKKSIYYRALEDEAAKIDIELKPFIQVNDVTAIMSLLKKGLGISFLPEYVINYDVMRGKLATLDIDGLNLQFWSQIFYQKDKWVTPPMEYFIEIVRNADRIAII